MSRIRRLHQNAQRLLRPLAVVNPYAKSLTFLDNQVRYRRDQPKYLALIRASALLHQYQRTPGIKVLLSGERLGYIEVSWDDVELANRLFAQTMGACLDELPQQTRQVLDVIYRERCAAAGIKQGKCLFTRKDVREYSEGRWHDSQLKVHLDRLTDLEYLLTRYGRNGQRYVYELLYCGEGQDGRRFALGLLDVTALRNSPGMTITLRGKA